MSVSNPAVVDNRKRRPSPTARLVSAVGLALVALLFIASRLQADQTAPYCSSAADAAGDKYECATTVNSPDYSTGTRTITNWEWMGTDGSGGYDSWQLDGIDVWDNNPNTPPPYQRQYVSHYGAEANTHSNETYPGFVYAYNFSQSGVTSGGNVFYCFRHHRNAYYDINGRLIQAAEDYSSWQDALDWNQGQSLGGPGSGCTSGY